VVRTAPTPLAELRGTTTNLLQTKHTSVLAKKRTPYSAVRKLATS
jgi:hypothetical protein